MAYRLQEFPKPNDFVAYKICDQSILLMRRCDYSIKSFSMSARTARPSGAASIRTTSKTGR